MTFPPAIPLIRPGSRIDRFDDFSAPVTLKCTPGRFNQRPVDIIFALDIAPRQSTNSSCLLHENWLVARVFQTTNAADIESRMSHFMKEGFHENRPRLPGQCSTQYNFFRVEFCLPIISFSRLRLTKGVTLNGVREKTLIELPKHFVNVGFIVRIECGIDYRCILVIELGGKIDMFSYPQVPSQLSLPLLLDWVPSSLHFG